MPESFGARLRQRREEQHIALVTIAEQTKIKLSLLEGLERDDVSQWPSGIFRRAFIRAYAHAIGLDPTSSSGSFSRSTPIRLKLLRTVAWPRRPQRTGERGPPTRLRNLVGSAIGSLSRLRRPTPVEERGAEQRAGHRRPVRARVPGCAAATSEPVPEPGLLDRRPRLSPTHLSDPAGLGRARLPGCRASLHRAGRVENTTGVQPLLQEAARLLDAIGLIVWVWDPEVEELMPAVACGYSEKVLAQLPTVRRDTDNATAAAFRSAQTCAINGSNQVSGALVGPDAHAVGVRWRPRHRAAARRRRDESVVAVAMIFAAQLAPLLGGAPAPAVRRRLTRLFPHRELQGVDAVGGRAVTGMSGIPPVND